MSNFNEFNNSQFMEWHRDHKDMSNHIMLGNLLTAAQILRALHYSRCHFERELASSRKEFARHGNQAHGIRIEAEIRCYQKSVSKIQNEILAAVAELVEMLPTEHEMGVLNCFNFFPATADIRYKYNGQIHCMRFPITAVPCQKIIDQNRLAERESMKLLFKGTPFTMMVDPNKEHSDFSNCITGIVKCDEMGTVNIEQSLVTTTNSTKMIAKQMRLAKMDDKRWEQEMLANLVGMTTLEDAAPTMAQRRERDEEIATKYWDGNLQVFGEMYRSLSGSAMNDWESENDETQHGEIPNGPILDEDQ